MAFITILVISFRIIGQTLCPGKHITKEQILFWKNAHKTFSLEYAKQFGKKTPFVFTRLLVSHPPSLENIQELQFLNLECTPKIF
jgi:hypothetical protein